MTAGAPLEPHSAAWYRLVLDSVSEVVLVMNEVGRLVWANHTTSVALGYDPAAQVGRNVLEFLHPDDVEETARLLTLSIDRGYAWPVEVRVRHANGSYLTMAVADMDAVSETKDQFVVTLRRVLNPRTASAVDANVSPLFVVLHHVSDAVVAIGGEGQVVFRNRAAIELFRIGVARVWHPLPAGIVLSAVASLVDDPPYRDPFVRVVEGDKVPRHEARLTFPDGSERLVEVTGEPLTDSLGLSAGGVVALRDVTELRRHEAELRELALRDALTGLANRTELMAHLRATLAERLLHGGHVVVMFVDLDRFKDVNDTFDHLVGDEVLQLTARRLVECAGANGLVARFGGEEFVVVTVQNSPDADTLARRIVERVREPMLTAAGELSTSCSVGLASGTGAKEPEQLLREADTAVYAAKRMGGATVAWYDRTQRERAVNRLRLARDATVMADAIRLLRYRPVVDLVTSRVVAVRGEVAEADRAVLFAHSALDRRLVAAFLEHMCMVDRLLRTNMGEAAPLLICSIASQAVAQRALMSEVHEVLDANGMPPERRVLDVVSMEPTVVIEPQLLATYVHDVQVRLMLDDARVLQAASLLELDLGLWAVRAPRELVRRLPDGRSADHHAVRALHEIAMAHGAPVAADRVDTGEQRRLVEGLEVRLAWGDALAPTVDLETLRRTMTFG